MLAHLVAVGLLPEAAPDGGLAVPVVAEGGQRAEPPLQIARAHVVEDQGGVLEVPVGEAGLDPLLAGEQPIEHGEHLVARDGAEIEQGAEAGVGRFRRESSRSGELGVRGEHAGHDGGEREVAFAAAAAMQDALEAQQAAGAEDGGDMAVGPGAPDTQELGRVLDGQAALEDGAEAVDDLGREGLARVFLRIRWPSRQASRSRMADLLARLGIISTWKETGEGYGNTTGNVSDHKINCNKK